MNYYCILCNSPIHKFYKKNGRTVAVCSKCKHINVPDGYLLDDENKTIYESEQPFFEKAEKKDYYLDKTNFISAGQKVKKIKKYIKSPDTRLLDIGANYGHFLSVVSKHCQAQGVEISKRAVDWSHTHLNVNNQVLAIEELQRIGSNKFNIVTMFDVIEHLEKPQEAIQLIKEVLDESGILVLSTPNSSSLAARLMGKSWYHIDAVQHINVFSKSNLVKLLKKEGFEILSSTSIGHYYRFGYVINKLFGKKNKLFSIVKLVLHPFNKLIFYLSVGDIMFIIARRSL